MTAAGGGLRGILAPVGPSAIPARPRGWWWQVLLIFAGSRIVTTAMMLWFAAHQSATSWAGAAPDYVSFAMFWDGGWYREIATIGYPTVLPLSETGHVIENAWAFMPVYPLIVGALSAVTGAGFGLAAVIVSVLAAAAWSLLTYVLMRTGLDHRGALWTVALASCAPVSAILQVGYAESLGLALLALALVLLVRRRYWALLPVVAVMGMTRPLALAFCFALVLHAVMRWRHRATDPASRREWTGLAAAIVVAGISGLGQLILAWAFTGSFTAYTDTELAWRSAYLGPVELVPFTPWFEGASWWAQFAGLPVILGVAILLILVGGWAALLLSPAARRLGSDVVLWLTAYSLYLLAVFFPQSSTWRLLAPLFPVVGLAAIPSGRRGTALRITLLVAGVAGQWWWIDQMWATGGADWTPP